MNRIYLTKRECFMIQRNFSTVNLLLTLIFISITHFAFSQGASRIGQTYLISDIHRVHQFNVSENEERFAVVNKSDNIDRETSRPDLHYFYEFPNGSFYIGLNSYVNRENERRIDNSIIFKATKIYDDEDKPPLFRTGSALNSISLPNLANKTNRTDSFSLHISHLGNDIVLDEEYVIAVNLGDEVIETTSGVLFLFNEVENQVFDNGNITPRPAASTGNLRPKIQDLKEEYKYQDHYFFENPRQNIFVNLKTKEIYNGSKGTFIVKAIAVNDEGKSIYERSMELTLFNSVERAHDPNDILVEPICFDPKDKPNALDYTVNFENVGGAKAIDVFIDVDVPNEIETSLIDYSTFNYNYPYSNPNFSYVLIGAKLHFELKGINLIGIGEEGVIKEQTMGNITFSLPLKDNIGYTSIKSNATILFKDGYEGKPCGNNCKGCDEDCKYPDLEPVITDLPAISEFKKECNNIFVENCLELNYVDGYESLDVRKYGEQYLLKIGGLTMVFSNQNSAVKAYYIITEYGLNKHCLSDSNNPGLRYFLVDNDIPEGKFEGEGKFKGEDCIPINSSNNLLIQQNPTTIIDSYDQQASTKPYSVIDSTKRNTLFYAKTKEEAEYIISIVKNYNPKYTCYVERPNVSAIQYADDDTIQYIDDIIPIKGAYSGMMYLRK